VNSQANAGYFTLTRIECFQYGNSQHGTEGRQ
jgi:hypothetical protein